MWPFGDQGGPAGIVKVSRQSVRIDILRNRTLRRRTPAKRRADGRGARRGRRLLHSCDFHHGTGVRCQVKLHGITGQYLSVVGWPAAPDMCSDEKLVRTSFKPPSADPLTNGDIWTVVPLNAIPRNPHSTQFCFLRCVSDRTQTPARKSFSSLSNNDLFVLVRTPSMLRLTLFIRSRA